MNLETLNAAVRLPSVPVASAAPVTSVASVVPVEVSRPITDPLDLPDDFFATYPKTPAQQNSTDTTTGTEFFVAPRGAGEFHGVTW